MKKTLTIAALSLCTAACGGDQPLARLRIDPPSVQLGYPQLRELTLTWEPLADLAAGTGAPTVFVHLLDQDGEVVRTFDHPFPRAWQTGAPVAYELKLYQSALAPELPPGRYRLTAGLWDEQSGERWPLEIAAGEELPRREYQVAEVEVPESRRRAPRFRYSPSWLPVEPGGDRQVLARRWLAGEGTIRVTRLRGAGTLWLVLDIPRGDGPDEKLVLEGGSNAPSVVVSGTCGTMESGLSGPGRHEIELPIAEPPQGGTCEIRLRPNFHLLKVGLPEKRSVALENLAWAPAAR